MFVTESLSGSHHLRLNELFDDRHTLLPQMTIVFQKFLHTLVRLLSAGGDQENGTAVIYVIHLHQTCLERLGSTAGTLAAREKPRETARSAHGSGAVQQTTCRERSVPEEMKVPLGGGRWWWWG